MFQDITYSVALAAGLFSFFSPCVLPLIPAYFTFITGLSLDELTREPSAAIRRKAVLSTMVFILGFSLVFISLGAVATFLGGMLFKFVDQIRVIGGGLIVLMGLYLTGLFKIRLFEFDKRVHLRSKPLHFLGAFVVGMAFAAGWSPCIGPQLTSILIMAGSKETVMEGILLLSTYSAGMGIPFLVLSIFVGVLLTFIKKTVRLLRYVNTTAGIILIIVGILLITNKLNFLPS
jgi:cytochrome c-type biogenesis protein